MAGNKTIGSILIGIGLESSKFQKELKNLEYSLGRTAKKWQSYGQEMSMALSLPIAGAATAAIKFASDYEESLNKVNVAFKDSSKSVQDFAKTSLKSFGIAEGTALDMAATFGDMATSLGLNTKQAGQMSTSLVGLAGDLASFKNISIDIANTALTGIFTGETESLKKLGIVMTEANLQAYAFSQGINKNIKDMSQSEKVMLRYNYILSVTSNSQGDFARTGGGAANQMRIFQESLKQLSVQFGTVILPTFTKIITKVNEWIIKFSEISKENRQLIITLSLIAAAIGPVVFGIGKIIQAGSGLIGIFRGLTAVSVASGGWITLAVVSLGYLIANWSDLNKLVSDAKTDIDELNVKTGFWKDLNLALADSFNVIKAVSGTFFDWYSNKVALITGETQDSLSLFEIAFGYGKKIGERFAGTRPAKATTIEGFQIPFVPYQGNYYEGNSGTFIPPKEKELLGGLGDVTKTATKGSIEWLNQEVTKLTNKLRENNLTPGGMLDTIKQIVNYEGQIKKLEDKIQSIKDSLLPRQAVGVVAPISTNIKPVQAAGLNLPTPEIIENTQSKLVNLTGALTTMANDGLMAATAGFTDMFAAMATGGDIAAAFNGLLLGLMDVLSQFAQVAIATGLASDGIKKALQLNPYAAIAGGIALLALTKIVKASLSNISKKQIPGYASGGIFTDESLIRVGEYAGASSNPEVVAPLDKLKDMLRLNGSAPMQLSIVIDSRLQGSDLMQSIKRTESKYSRM